MKMLCSDRGLSLIVLLITIVILGLIGAGIVSFMGVKQRSYPIQVRSYQALNIASAGVEFAIRYANDNINPNGDHADDFIGKPYNYIKCYTASTLIPECSSHTGRTTVAYGSGQFSLSYDVDSNTLYSRGISGTTIREVKLNNFSGYFSSGCLSLVPGALNAPHQISGDNKGIHIPLVNNTGSTLYVFRIDIGMPDSTGADYIKEILYKRESRYGGSGDVTQVYYYLWDFLNPYYKFNNGIRIPATPAVAQMTFNVAPFFYSFPATGITTDILEFKSSARMDYYYIVFHYSDNLLFTNPQTSTIFFKVSQSM
jgi:hypothetical protein